MESQVSFDHEGSVSPETVFIKDVITSETNVASNLPVKKPTRQWAAWTRQEEESFFTALRQVGKNFEKITSRVQSKNKDQVRHYYYRLVRRMNKLLGPELSLDAKNSKDTNAAMLRWWSLLEKHSCKASKLHLKPRRFKIFLETLEHQLLKDRKKKRKRLSQAENCSTTPSNVANQGRASGHDARIKLVFVDSQNIQKLGTGKASSLRRNAITGVERNNCKGDPSLVKPARQRRRSGTASAAAYKRWEKAAIAGVSLVADAAEHLERTALDKLVNSVQDIQGDKGLAPVAKHVPGVPAFQQNVFPENDIQPNVFPDNNIQPLMKLKLQLFPVDENTRRTLEMDNHNPHLELTLSTRKKISSVLEHLTRKWGSSSIASGELTLVPYSAQSSNLMSCQKWTQDSALSAADVYAAIGSPPVFRLRYGWFADVGGCEPLQEPLGPSADQSINLSGEAAHDVDLTECPHQLEHNLVHAAMPRLPATHDSEKSLDHNKDKLVSAGKITALAASSSDFHGEIIECFNMGTQRNCVESSDHVSRMSWQRREMSNGAIKKQLGHMDNMGSQKNTGLSTLEWADSLTNISVGDLLSDVSHNTDANLIDPTVLDGTKSLQQIPFSCDSFDAAIAAHINKHHSRTAIQPTLVSSIWDAEETCDAFSFQKNTVVSDKIETCMENCKQAAAVSPVRLGSDVEKLPEAEEPMDDHPEEEHLMDVCHLEGNPDNGSAKDLSTLADIYWPDSLGPLDLDVPSCRYHSDDLILSDSLSGLNRLTASSLDAFQNCSLFGLERREPVATTVGAQGTASFVDDKINDEV